MCEKNAQIDLEIQFLRIFRNVSLIFETFLVYIEVGPSAGATAKLDFTFGTSTTVTRKWEVKVTQIECSSTSKPYE